jgi:hypothetical protein
MSQPSDLEAIYKEITDKRGGLATVHTAFEAFPGAIASHF